MPLRLRFRAFAFDHLVCRLHLFASAEHEGADEDSDQEWDEGESETGAHRRSVCEREDQAHDRTADAADPDQDVADPPEPGAEGRDLLWLHYLRPEEPPPLDPRVEGEQEHWPQHASHYGVVEHYEGKRQLERDESQEGYPPGDDDGAGHRGQDNHRDIHSELLAGIYVGLYVLVTSEVSAPHLVGQQGQKEVPDEPGDAPQAQRAEEVADEVAYRGTPGPRRAEQQSEDHGEHVGRTDLDVAWHDRKSFERDQDRRVDRRAQRHKNHQLGVSPHRKNFLHFRTSLRTCLRYLVNPSSPPYPAIRSAMHPARSATNATRTSASLPPMAVRRKKVRPEPAPNPFDSSAMEKTLVERTVVTKTGTRSGR